MVLQTWFCAKEKNQVWHAAVNELVAPPLRPRGPLVSPSFRFGLFPASQQLWVFWLLFFFRSLLQGTQVPIRRQGRREQEKKQSSHSQTMLAPLRFRALRSTVAAQFSLLACSRARSEIVAERRCAATRVLLLLSFRSRRPGFSGFWLLACVLVFFFFFVFGAFLAHKQR